jgi:hypothetical protein
MTHAPNRRPSKRSHMPARTYATTVTRRGLALAGVASVTLGVLLVPWAAGQAAAEASALTSPVHAGATISARNFSATPSTSASATPTPTASPTPSVSPSPTATPTPTPTRTKKPKPKKPPPFKKPVAPPGGVLIQGKQLWDPATNKKLTHASYITASAVASLTNQVVDIKWFGFTPSSDLTYNATGTDYPVMVAECKGLHPTKWTQCFGASNGGVTGEFSAYGPQNTAFGTTDANGEGAAPIQLLTAQENSFLGCNLNSPCSLVVVPAQGGNVFNSPVNCNDHSQDSGLTDLGSFSFTSSFGECSWRDRFIVPLHFAQTPTDCPVKNPDFSIIGSPMMGRAMNSWQAGLCASSAPVNLQYDESQAEPLARTDFLDGLDDVALTTVAASGLPATHPFTYAPVAVSAESVVFWVDDPKTGQPLTRLKLDPRLVAKLLTQSYDFEGEACSGGQVAKGGFCDNAVDNNPQSLFADPEFRQLNHHVAAVGDGYQVPTVMSGESDMTWELTRWIAASKRTFDPWGEHVNTDYLNMQLPTNSLSSMDAFPPIAHRYDPVFPLSAVAQYQVENWYPATAFDQDPAGNYDKLSPQIPGQRALFAILDEADAVAYQLPVAALENAAGKYVAPTSASMAAALGAMRTSATNHITKDSIERAKVKGAYPLTMVIYAMVPTGGISRKKAAKIAQWLDFVAGSGQAPGSNAGQLPPGYLPLTGSMRAQTLKAAQEVLHQSGKAKPAPVATPSAAPTATPSQTATSGTVSLGFVSNPFKSGVARYAIPILLITGGLLAVAGSFSFAIGRGGSAAVAQLRKLRLPRLPLPRRKKP